MQLMFEIVVHVFLLMKNVPRHGREKKIAVHVISLSFLSLSIHDSS